jgi:gliding motility-associated-like protein
LFIIRNLEDYDQVELIVLNRWGNLIYSNENYQNDWKGTLPDGKEINEGVYFYKVRPVSTKYEYLKIETTSMFFMDSFM